MNSESVPAVTAEEAERLVAAGALLLDVREPEEWEAGHAPAARHIPLGALPERMGQLAPDRRVIAVCRLGGRSEMAATALAGQGYDVANLSGGMQAWAEAGLPVVTDAGDPGRVA